MRLYPREARAGSTGEFLPVSTRGTDGQREIAFYLGIVAHVNEDVPGELALYVGLFFAVTLKYCDLSFGSYVDHDAEI